MQKLTVSYWNGGEMCAEMEERKEEINRSRRKKKKENEKET